MMNRSDPAAEPAALLKAQPEDFRVDEELGFVADGAGEHDLLHLRKTSANTNWVATQLARFAGVAPLAVGYCGLKDRHAITSQYFSVQLPGRSCDWSRLDLPGVEVLDVARHSRKLKRGSHRGNRFELVLRQVRPDPAELDRKLAAIAQVGVPNRFGAQRFGREGGNLRLFERLCAGARLDRTQRGFALSAARAEVFNAVLDARIERGDWCRLLDGELVMLDGGNSFFGPASIDQTLQERCAGLDVHPSGPLVGAGPSRVGGVCAALEDAVLAQFPQHLPALAQAGLSQERRALRVRVSDLHWSWTGTDQLTLAFNLGRGAFATALVDWLLGGDCGWPDAEEY